MKTSPNPVLVSSSFIRFEDGRFLGSNSFKIEVVAKKYPGPSLSEY